MLTTFTFSKDTVGFLLEGTITKGVVESLNNAIEEKLAHYEKINLYLEDANVSSFTLPAIISQITFKLNNRSRFNKIAFVTNRKWIQLCVTIDDTILEGDINYFPTDERLEAIAWIADDLNL